MGMGTDSCANFGKNYQHDPQNIEAEYFTWAQGFMSGMNLVVKAIKHRNRSMDGMPLADQQRIIRQFCEEHPLSNYLSAVIELMDKLPLSPETTPPN